MKETTTPEAARSRVAVIILNWNGEKLLRRYLPSVVATTNSEIADVIVADNGSTDGSLAYIRAEFPETVELMEFPENLGFAGGYNEAIGRLSDSYGYVVLLNSDVETTPRWCDTLLNYMEEHSGCGACQPKLLSDTARDTFEYAGAAGGFIDRNGYPYCRGRIFGTCEKDRGQYDTVAEVFWATGACFMVRRELYVRCGGLDARFFAHMEEIDLCWRIRLAGYTIAAVPQATVYHLGGGSLPADNPKKTYLNFRNNLLMLYKNLPAKGRAGFLFRRRLLDTLAWLKFVAGFDFANASAVVKAHRDYASMRKEYSCAAPCNLLRSDADSRRNILLEYYLRGHKTYDRLS